ncbi:MAG: HD-GYP domain-containing protein [Armatimonadetes bacterium]|nr:HD-GYP domain-containing protein [Armatimonadota bacterium]
MRLLKSMTGEPTLPPRSIMWALAERMTQMTFSWLEQAFPNGVPQQGRLLHIFRIALQQMCPLHFSHCERVADMALQLARELGLNQEERKQLRQSAEHKDMGMIALQLSALTAEDQELLAGLLIDAGDLHDIGKLALPAEILDCPRTLTNEEFELVKLHPLVGEALLSSIEELELILPAVRGHHERWDGRGYPDGLAGDDIPLAARIISIVDSFDAMTGPRPYRESISPRDAGLEILKNAGSQFDPELAQIFGDMVLDGLVSQAA